MDSVLDHLDGAIHEIEQAHEKAPLGTRMMIAEEKEGFVQLRERVANILERQEEQDDD